MDFAVTATRITRPTSKDSDWERVGQVPTFTVQASSQREATIKAFDILGTPAERVGEQVTHKVYVGEI